MCMHEIESETKVILKMIPRRRNVVSCTHFHHQHAVFGFELHIALDTIKIIETTQSETFRMYVHINYYKFFRVRVLQAREFRSCEC